MSDDMTPTVFAIGQMNISGLVIDHHWLHTLKYDSGKPDIISCLVMAEIVYWYRPKTILDEAAGLPLGYRKKFKADMLQRSYQALADKLGLTKRQVKESLDRLESNGFVRREFRTIETKEGLRLNSVLFLEPVPEQIKKITGPQSPPPAPERTTTTTPADTPPTPERTNPIRQNVGQIQETPIQEIPIQDSRTPPARAREENSQPQPDNSSTPQTPCEPKTPRDWAQCFIQRCGYRIDQAITPKSMAMFRQWLVDGVTLEDVEDAAAAAEAKLGGYPSNPTYYRGFVAEVVSEKQRAKENPVSFRNQPGSIRKSPTSKRMLADDNFDNKHYVGTPEEEIWWLQ